MQRAERRQASIESRSPRTLQEADYLLGVTDVSRLGALRFKQSGSDAFQKPTGEGVPQFIHLGRLLKSAERIESPLLYRKLIGELHRLLIAFNP